MTTTQSLLSAILFIAGLSSCDLQDEKIPSYVFIDKFSFVVKQGEGTAHQNLTDGWITVNGNYYGAYELPAWIPVLEEGPSDILLFPGYRQNGAITNTFKYALLETYSTKVVFTPRQTDTIRPVTRYQDGLKFYNVTFDGSIFFSDVDGDPETQIILSPDSSSFEGANSGLITLTSSHNFLFTEDKLNNIVILQSVDPIILELDFKSDIQFSIGFVGYDSFGTKTGDHLDATVLPKNVWTKIYFDFQSILNTSNSDHYHIAITAVYDPSNPLPVQRILLDNIKVVHR